MDPWQIVLIVLAMLAIAASFWSLIYVVNYSRRTGDWINNHVPLGDTDVDEQYIICTTCGVDNAAYRIFCVLCGAPVEKVVGADADEPLLEESGRDETERRASLYHEWSRTQDNDGTFHWQPQGGRASETPAYVLVCRRKSPPVAIDVEESGQNRPVYPELEHADGLARVDEQSRLKYLEIPEVCAQLKREYASLEVRLAPAKLINPLEPVIHVDLPPYRLADLPALEEVMSTATVPFPERLATFVTHATAIQNTSGRLNLKLQRADLLRESLTLLAALPPSVVQSPLRLKFLEEAGIDAGGVYREWFLLLNEAIVAPTTGIFHCVDEHSQCFFLNPHSRDQLGDHHVAYFLSAGRWLGRALLEGNVTGFHLALPLLKMIVGQPFSFHDLAFFDPEVYKHLVWLLENDHADTLGLTFTSVEQLPGGDAKVVELIPGGARIDVTDANKHEFIDRKLKYLLVESVAPQLAAFLRGIHEVVPMQLLRLFDATELDYMLAGSDTISVDDWEQHTKFTADLIEHPVREWFWELVREMSHEQRRWLLQFATGASRVPLAGFAALTSYDGRLCPFTLKGVKLKHEAYIRSHACFNTLDLPLYRDKDQLRRMLEGILLDGDRQGFTVA